MGGGASSPSGAGFGGTSSAGAAIGMQNELGGAVNSALSARMMSAQIEQVKTLTGIAKADLAASKIDQDVYSSRIGPALRFYEKWVAPLMNSGASTYRNLTSGRR